MPTSTPPTTVRYFLTYRGVSLPLKLAEELTEDALRNRNTYFRAGYDAAGCMAWVEKLVYGEVEMRHDYHWDAEGRLDGATLQWPDEEPQVLRFGGDVRSV